MKYNIFGSEDSLDYDVMVFVDKIPDLQESKKYCFNLEKDFVLKDKKANINLAVINDGIIIDVHKGTADECNNSIYHTYQFHKQQFPKLVIRTVDRDCYIKAARALRIILSFISRTNHRIAVKQALKSSADIKIETLRKIDFKSIDGFNKNNQDTKDVIKQIVFQIAQTLLLIDNIEVYSKKSCYEYFPELTPFLKREDNVDMALLDQYKHLLLDKILKLDISKVKE